MGLFSGWFKPKVTEPDYPKIMDGPGPNQQEPDWVTHFVPNTPQGWAGQNQDLGKQWDNAWGKWRNVDPAIAPDTSYLYTRNSYNKLSEPEKLESRPLPETVIPWQRNDDPRWHVPQTDRPVRTQSSFRFWRGMGLHYERLFNGAHYSQATQVRTYPSQTGGIAPPRRGRNTWRVEPTPNDELQVDLPPASYIVTQARYESPVADRSKRGYRL